MPDSFQEEGKKPFDFLSVDLEKHNEREKISAALPGSQEGCKRQKMKLAETF